MAYQINLLIYNTIAMSTEFKSLERVDRKAAYDLQNRVNKIRENAKKAAKQAREQAQGEAQAMMDRERKKHIERETAKIAEIKANADNRLARQEAEHRDAVKKSEARTRNTIAKESAKQRQAMRQSENRIKNKIAKQDAEHREAILKQTKLMNHRLRQQSSEFQSKINAVQRQNKNDINKLRNETKKVTKNLSTEMDKAFKQQDEINANQQGQINTINSEINDVRSQIATVKADVKNLQQNIENQEEYAKELYESCIASINDFKEDIAVRRFQKEELKRIINSVNAEKNNINIAPQGSISQLTQARLGLMEIKEKAAMCQAIYDSLYENVLANAKGLLNRMQENENNTFHEEENEHGEVVQHKIDLDKWTKNIYSTLKDDVVNIERKLHEALDKPEIGLNELEELTSEVQVLEVKHEDLLANAVNEFSSSLERSDIANEVIEKLLDEGFSVQDNGNEEGYIGEDPTEGYYATLVNDNNDQINISITVEGDDLKSRISIQNNSAPGELTAIEMASLRNLTQKSLSKDGCEVENIDVEDKKVFDPNALKTTKLSPEQKRRLNS